MNELSLEGHDGQPIADWHSWTRPKAEYHWRAGRSAMELARAWFTGPHLPSRGKIPFGKPPRDGRRGLDGGLARVSDATP